MPISFNANLFSRSSLFSISCPASTDSFPEINLAKANIAQPINAADQPSRSLLTRSRSLSFINLHQPNFIQAHSKIKAESYLSQLIKWQLAALETAYSDDEINGINNTVQRIKTWVEKKQREVQLDLTGLNLKSAPSFPDGLMDLNLADNLLNTLPDLPASLHELDASNNQLSALPESFPIQLNALDLHGNQITRLPTTLPPELEVLDIRQNRLICLPEALPTTLIVLLLQDNPITSLPEIITTLRRECRVHLGGIPLPDSVLNHLHTIASALDYDGPHFYITQALAPVSAPQLLSESAALWYPPERQAIAKQAWSELDENENAVDFSLFLATLKSSIHFSHIEFKKEICDWLDRLIVDSELRDLIFVVTKEGIGTCEDRAALILNQMYSAQINLDIQHGKYDDRLDHLISLSRTFFRLDELEIIARKKANSLRLVDEVEVYLAYQVKLHKALSLPLKAAQMRFFDVSYVTQDDLDSALFSIRNKEKTQFFNYLVNDWAPWQTVLKRLAPHAYQSAQNKLSFVASEEFFSRQSNLLAIRGLPDNEHNRIQTAPEVLKSMNSEIKGELTRSFLAERQLSV